MSGALGLAPASPRTPGPRSAPPPLLVSQPDASDWGFARLQRTDGGPTFAYRCPLHDADHVVPYAPGFARQYLAATADGLCCCPGGAAWSVRHGLARTRLLAWLLVALWFANLCDLLLTMRLVASGQATEANGVMRYFLHSGSLAAGVFKLGLVSGAVVLLWRLRHRGVVLRVTAALVVVFTALVVYEALSLVSG